MKQSLKFICGCFEKFKNNDMSEYEPYIYPSVFIREICRIVFSKLIRHHILLLFFIGDLCETAMLVESTDLTGIIVAGTILLIVLIIAAILIILYTCREQKFKGKYMPYETEKHHTTPVPIDLEKLPWTTGIQEKLV